MRRGLVTLFLLLSLPAAALAAPDAAGDGTLSVKRGDGTVLLELDRGAVIGRIGGGVLRILNPKNDDCDALLVWEQSERADYVERIIRGETACVYTGRAMRFRVVGGAPTMRLTGRDISISAAGRGLVYLRGRPTVPEDGVFARDGDEYESLPDLGRWYDLGDGPLPTASQ